MGENRLAQVHETVQKCAEHQDSREFDHALFVGATEDVARLEDLSQLREIEEVEKEFEEMGVQQPGHDPQANAGISRERVSIFGYYKHI